MSSVRLTQRESVCYTDDAKIAGASEKRSDPRHHPIISFYGKINGPGNGSQHRAHQCAQSGGVHSPLRRYRQPDRRYAGQDCHAARQPNPPQDDDFLIRVEGRADGIIAASGEEPALIDEIKGIVRPVEHLEEPVDVHLAQAKCYAFIYAKQQNLDRIRVRMSYVNLEALDEGTARLLDRMRFFTFEYSAGDLKTWFYGVLDEYKKWARFEQAWKQIRNESIRQTAFPGYLPWSWIPLCWRYPLPPAGRRSG